MKTETIPHKAFSLYISRMKFTLLSNGEIF